MEGWTYLSSLLDKMLSRSTAIGKIWLTILFFFRILVLSFGAEGVWGNEQSDIICNTQMPLCEKICYDQALPLSHIRFWFLQIMFVTTPTVVYLGYVMLSFHQQNKLSICSPSTEGGQHLKKPRYCGKLRILGNVLGSYMVNVMLKILFETAFIIGQYYLYGFVLEPVFSCGSPSCPHLVDCAISQTTEKTIFIILMFVLACLSLLLNVMEMVYLIFSRRERKHQVNWNQITMAGDSLESAKA